MSEAISEVYETRCCDDSIDFKAENRFFAGLKSILKRYQAWYRAGNTRKTLLLADDRALRDIGVRRRDIQSLSDRSNSRTSITELEIRMAQPTCSRVRRYR